MKKKGGDEARITAVMAQHLFSQLIPGNKYCIDNRSKNLPKVCPCQQPDCGKEIKAGCTALGIYRFMYIYVVGYTDLYQYHLMDSKLTLTYLFILINVGVQNNNDFRA